MPLVVGVDAGGSHSTAALAHGDTIVRTAAGDCANVNAVGYERAGAAIAAVVQRVLDGESAAAIGVGAAGAGSEAIQKALRATLQAYFPAAQVTVAHDARIALRAEIPDGDGSVLVAGTGAIAYGEIAGRTVRAGGYGYLLGEPGSGYALGAAALRLLLAAAGGDISNDPLLRELAVHVGASDRTGVLTSIYASPVPVAYIAACAPLVLRYANQDEPRADAVVRDAAQALFEMTRAVARSHADRILPLVFAGGLLRAPNALRDLIEARIARELPALRVVKDGKEPYFGALALARQALQTA